MKKIFVVFFSFFLLNSCLIKERDKERLFFLENNDELLSSFIDNAIGNLSLQIDSLIVLLSFSIVENDTLATMSAAPYPCMLEISESDYFQILHYHGVLVSLYDFSGGGICHSIIDIPPINTDLITRVQKDMCAKPEGYYLHGHVELYRVNNGLLTKVEIPPSVEDFEDKDFGIENSLP